MPALPLSDIPSGADILLDANVLIYAMSGTSSQCVALMDRCNREEVSAFTTVEIVNEFCHRMMVAEAFAKGLIARPSIGALKGRAELIRGLGEYWVQTQRVLASNLLVLELAEERIRRAQRLRETHGLLTTDATILAAAVELGIGHLATNDADFEKASEVIVYRPLDLP